MKLVIELIKLHSVTIQKEGLMLLYEYFLLPSTPLHFFLDNKDILIAVMPHLLSNNGDLAQAAYHVLKLFVCKPTKALAVHELLYVNRQKLIMILCMIPCDSCRECGNA